MTSPRRVCFPFVGDRLGGSHVSTLLLIKHLDRRRFDPVIVLHQEAGPLAAHLARQAMPFEVLPLPLLPGGKNRGLGRDLYAFLRLLYPVSRFLRQRQVRIVHTQDLRVHLTWGLAARLFGVAFLWHQRSRIEIERKHRVIRWTLAAANRIVCISRFVASHLSERRWADKLTVIANPFDTKAPKPERKAAKIKLKREFGLADDAKIVASVGNLRPQKRAAHFIEVAAKLRDNGGGAIAFLLFGEVYGNHRREIEAHLQRFDLQDHVLLVGFKTPIETYIAGCDLLLCPAIEEGFGRTLVEAMSVGTPVIAVDSGGHREILRHGVNGILVPPDDVAAMAEAAAELLTDPESARRLADSAAGETLDRYAIERHVVAMMEIYEDLLGPQRRLPLAKEGAVAPRG